MVRPTSADRRGQRDAVAVLDGWSARGGPRRQPARGPGRAPGRGPLPDPRDLMVHCAQEMNHLAAFLPDLHGALAG
jgi:hypothetical protein